MLKIRGNNFRRKISDFAALVRNRNKVRAGIVRAGVVSYDFIARYFCRLDGPRGIEKENWHGKQPRIAVRKFTVRERDRNGEMRIKDSRNNRRCYGFWIKRLAANARFSPGIFYRRENLSNRVWPLVSFRHASFFWQKKKSIKKKKRRKNELFDVHAMNSRNAIAGLSNWLLYTIHSSLDFNWKIGFRNYSWKKKNINILRNKNNLIN